MEPVNTFWPEPSLHGGVSGTVIDSIIETVHHDNVTEKNHADDKKQLTSLPKKISEELNKFDQKSLKTIDELFEKIESNHTEVLTQNFFETFVLHFDKNMKDLKTKLSEVFSLLNALQMHT